MIRDADEFCAAFNVSRETAERLELYAGLLKQWNPAINLVAPSSLDEIWQRHFADSMQLSNLAPKSATTWVDLGSGAGFPGMVVALARPHPTTMTCVESDLRKATFLRRVAQETRADITIISKRIEDVAPIGADMVSARALAPLDKLLGLVIRHLSPQGTALLPKGEGWCAEVDKALETWSFSFEKHPSRTRDGAVILAIKDIARA